MSMGIKPVWFDFIFNIFNVKYLAISISLRFLNTKGALFNARIEI